MEDLRVVYENSNRKRCSDRALVLAAAHIPYQLIDDGQSCVLVVPAEYSARAAEEIRLYEEENPPPKPRVSRRIVYQDALPGVIGYVLVVWLWDGWYHANSCPGALNRGLRRC